jgi:gluconolactonase
MKKLQLVLILTFLVNLGFPQVTKLNNGTVFQFLEGPAWDGKGALYFSDQNAQKVYKYVPGTGFSIIRTGQVTNGIAFDTTGLMYVCEQGSTNRVVKMDTNGVVKTVIASKYNNIGFNNPNDVCKDEKGGIYFSDPTWGTVIQDKKAVYYVNAAGLVTRVSGDFNKPNGLALSPDKTLLYVDDTENKNVFVFDVQPDGSAINKRVFCVLNIPAGTTTSGADGLKVDSDGNLYVTSTLGVQIFNSAGVWKNTISVPETPANVAFGGSDWSTLFITARTGLYSIHLTTHGIPFLTSVSRLKTNNLKMYPNPAKNIITIQNDANVVLTVLNLLGQPVIQKFLPANNNSIDLSNISNGMYIFKLKEKNRTISRIVVVNK